MAGTFVIKPRPPEAAGELAQSMLERRAEMREIGGLDGIAQIGRRLSAVRRLKVAACGRGLTPEELEPIAPAVDRKAYSGIRERMGL